MSTTIEDLEAQRQRLMKTIATRDVVEGDLNPQALTAVDETDQARREADLREAGIPAAGKPSNAAPAPLTGRAKYIADLTNAWKNPNPTAPGEITTVAQRSGK